MLVIEENSYDDCYDNNYIKTITNELYTIYAFGFVAYCLCRRKSLAELIRIFIGGVQKNQKKKQKRKK